MKLFLKVLKISLLVFFLSLCTLLVAGWLMQDRMTKYALDELSNTFEAPLATDKVSFSLIQDFPLGSIQFEGLWLGTYQWNENNEIQAIDTLAKIDNLYVSVNTRDLLNEIFTIRKVELQGGYIQYLVDENGVSCYDFLMESDSTVIDEETESDPLDLTAEDIVISNTTIIYQDDQLRAKAKILIPEVKGMVKLKDPKTYAKIVGELQLSDLYFEDTKVNRMQTAYSKVDFVFRSDTLDIENFAFQTDELNLTTSGRFVLGDEMYANLDATFNVPSISSLTKYAPDDLLPSYEVSQLSGALDIKAKILGFIKDGQLPHYEVTMDLSKAALKYQNYPLIYNIGLKADATNGISNNNTTTAIKLSQLALDFSGNHVDLKGAFSNLDKLNYTMSSNLDIDLDASKALIPDTLAQKIGGKIKMQLATKGTVPDSIDSEFVASALKNTSAEISFDQFNLVVDKTINLEGFKAQLDYADHKIRLKNLYAALPDYKIDLINNSLQLQMSGDPLVPESMTLRIPAFHLATSEGSIDGSAVLAQLKYLDFAVNSRLDLDLSELKRFAPDTLVNNMKGQLQAAIQSKGKLNLDKMEDSEMESIMYDYTNFDLTFKNINLNMKDTLMSVNNLSGRIIKENHQIAIDDLKGAYQGMTFNIETTKIENLFNTALRNQSGTLKVNGIYRFGDLDYKILGAFASEEEESTPPIEAKPEPTNWNYEINGQLFVKSFKYDNIEVRGIEVLCDINDIKKMIRGNIKVAQTQYDNMAAINQLSTKFEMDMSTNELKGKLAVKDVKYEDAFMENFTALYNVKDTFSTITIDQLKFTGFGGESNSSFQIHLKPDDKMEIEMKSNIAELDVRRLMKEMKNFNQTEMTYEQLNGILSSDNLFLRMTMIGDSLIYPDLMMTCDLTFKDGGIYNYPAVQDMAEYLPKVDNLDTMSFKTIDTHMFIFNDAVYVPRTYVVTSEFDVEAIGKQSFGEEYQYHIGVNLKEILKGKKEKELNEDKPIERKKMVRLVATTSKTGIDKVKDREKMETIIFTKERSLKLAFHPKWFNFETGVKE